MSLKTHMKDCQAAKLSIVSLSMLSKKLFHVVYDKCVWKKKSIFIILFLDYCRLRISSAWDPHLQCFWHWEEFGLREQEHQIISCRLEFVNVYSMSSIQQTLWYVDWSSFKTCCKIRSLWSEQYSTPDPLFLDIMTK